MNISDKTTLRDMYGEPRERSVKKQLPRLDVHCRNFIALSPFLVIGSAGTGGTDVSPRGDAPGFVATPDDHTLIIPDRPGNRRLDTLQNLLDNPQVGILFFVPGIEETLRVNGRAEITADPARLEPLAVKGKAPQSALVVEVREAYLHCARALLRSDLWNPERRVERSAFPSMGRVLADQIGTDWSPEDDKAHREQQLKTLY